MKTFKFYKFVLALVAAVLLSAAASEINTAYAAPAASATNLKGVVGQNTVDVHYHRHHNRWVGPAVALGIFGAAAAAAAAQNNRGYYEQPYGYYEQPRQRCWVQTGPHRGQGYWAWC
jgi:L-alanine-DL-glutamate epimerase-like enolase superfamily enzyme